MNYLKTVEEFHQTFDQVVLKKPELPTPARVKLRIGLIQEELDELKAAYADGNLVEVADALCDLMYVVSGTVLESGLKDRFEIMFKAVHESNMSKACSSYDEALATVAHYGVECDIRAKELNGKQVFLVFRTSDDKLLKSINYNPVNLAMYL